jgi:protein TIF31
LIIKEFAAQDTQMLGTVIVRHRGFIAIVEAAGTSIESGEVLPTDLAVEEHPEGGANALNLNRCLLSLPLSHIHQAMITKHS